MHPPHLHNTSS